MLKVTQLLKIRFGVRVMHSNPETARSCHWVTLDEGFKLSMVYFFTKNTGMMKPSWDFVRIKADVGTPPVQYLEPRRGPINVLYYN